MDPRSPGSQGLTRTPILLKTQKDDDAMHGEQKEEHTSQVNKIPIPNQGTDTCEDKPTEESKPEANGLANPSMKAGTEVEVRIFGSVQKLKIMLDRHLDYTLSCIFVIHNQFHII